MSDDFFQLNSIVFGQYEGLGSQKVELSRLCNQWQAQEDFWDLSTLCRYLESPVAKLLFMQDSLSQWLGMALFQVCGDDSELLYIYVDPEYRRKNLGDKILRNSVNFLIAREGVRRISLEVRKSNEAAINLYKRNGFRKVGERKRYYSDGEDAWIFSTEGLI